MVLGLPLLRGAGGAEHLYEIDGSRVLTQWASPLAHRPRPNLSPTPIPPACATDPEESPGTPQQEEQWREPGAWGYS